MASSLQAPEVDRHFRSEYERFGLITIPERRSMDTQSPGTTVDRHEIGATMAGKLMQWLNEYWAAARHPNGLEPQRIAESGNECETSPLDLILRDVREEDSDQFEIQEKDLDQPENGATEKLTWGPVRQLISSACLLIGMVSGILFFVAFVSMPAPQAGGHMTRGLNRLGNVLLMFGSLITLFVFPLVGLAVASLDVSIRKSHDKVWVALLGNIGCVLVAISIVVLTWLCAK